MKNKQLEALHQWMNRVKNIPDLGNVFVTLDEAKSISGWIKQVADDFEVEYPFYKSNLDTIAQKLFMYARNPMVMPKLNSAVFGELCIIEWLLYNQPFDLQFWSNIHPRI